MTMTIDVLNNKWFYIHNLLIVSVVARVFSFATFSCKKKSSSSLKYKKGSLFNVHSTGTQGYLNFSSKALEMRIC